MVFNSFEWKLASYSICSFASLRQNDTYITFQTLPGLDMSHLSWKGVLGQNYILCCTLFNTLHFKHVIILKTLCIFLCLSLRHFCVEEISNFEYQQRYHLKIHDTDFSLNFFGINKYAYFSFSMPTTQVNQD